MTPNYLSPKHIPPIVILIATILTSCAGGAEEKATMRVTTDAILSTDTPISTNTALPALTDSPVPPSDTATPTLTETPTSEDLPDSQLTPQPATSMPPTHTPTAIPSGPPPGAALGDTWIRPADGMIMLYVPAGSFQMGSDPNQPDADWDESPQHEVFLDAFWIDRTEVTNAMYRACVADGTCRESLSENEAFDGDRQPVVFISGDNAEDYCAWAGVQLPTEAQWEYAARGPENLEYPWGDAAPDSSLLNYHGNVGTTTTVGSYPEGQSWVGALDMAGNAWEWVADWYASDYYENAPADNPTGPAAGELRVLRGGSWDLTPQSVRGATRDGVLSFAKSYLFGFRCAASEVQRP